MTWVAVAIIGAGALGAGASYAGSEKQSKAANNAAGSQMQMFGQTQQNLYPWMTGGNAALSQLEARLGIQAPSTPDWQAYLTANPDVAANSVYGTNPQGHYSKFGQREGRALPMTHPAGPGSPGFGDLTKPFTLADFQQSPGYQFNLQQGQMAIDKASNARGNLYAPQTLQDISKYSQGLASNEFNNAYNQYTGQQQQQFNMLNSLSSGGQNAAAGIGGFGSNAVSAAGQYQTSGAAAQAGGYMGMANAASGAGLGLAGYNQYLQGMQQPTYADAGGGSYGGVPLSALSQYYGYGGGGATPQMYV